MRLPALLVLLLGCLGGDREFVAVDLSEDLDRAECAIASQTGDAELAAAVVDVAVYSTEDYGWSGRYEPNGRGAIYLDADRLSALSHEIYAHRLADLTEGDPNRDHSWCWEQMERVLERVERECRP